jgi:methionyl-tRNA formyltransferase
MQPEKFTLDVVEKLKNFDADVGIVVSYGKIIPKTIFNLPKQRTFNIHFSLLPKYRGAAPVQYALLNGETETGVTSFYIEKELDAGDVIVQEKLAIDIDDNAQMLFDKIIPLGVKVMNKTLMLFKDGKRDGSMQTGNPTFAPLLKKEDGLVDWNKSAVEIYNQYRGLCNWPGINSIVSRNKLVGKRIKFAQIEVFETNRINENPGSVYSIEKNKGLVISCAKGNILVLKVQPENKPVMHAWDFIQGAHISTDDKF